VRRGRSMDGFVAPGPRRCPRRNRVLGMSLVLVDRVPSRPTYLEVVHLKERPRRQKPTPETDVQIERVDGRAAWTQQAFLGGLGELLGRARIWEIASFHGGRPGPAAVSSPGVCDPARKSNGADRIRTEYPVLFPTRGGNSGISCTAQAFVHGLKVVTRSVQSFHRVARRAFIQLEAMDSHAGAWLRGNGNDPLARQISCIRDGSAEVLGPQRRILVQNPLRARRTPGRESP